MAEPIKWITVNGKHIPIYDEDTSNVAVEKVSDEEKEARKTALKSVKQARKDFLIQHQSELESGELDIDSPIVEEYKRLGEEAIDAEYEAHRVMPPIMTDETKWKQGISALTREEAIVARKDMLADKDMYKAIQMASMGTSYGNSTMNTEVDDLYESNPDKYYSTFAKTRDVLREKYGDTITLYRAGTGATAKATVNMASTEMNANQYADWYGTKVSKQEVPVDNILAVNISRNGGYEEFIILNKKGKR